MFEQCPCGGGATYLACCARLHAGQKTAETPEELMRARYSAYAKGRAAFILESWSPRTRPARLDALDAQKWIGLTVHSAPPPRGDRGEVRFSARYLAGGEEGRLDEHGLFERQAGRWFYVGAVRPS
ncbi:MAG: YchJ family metal-binding protein [Pseudomonadota bacterium]